MKMLTSSTMNEKEKRNMFIVELPSIFIMWWNWKDNMLQLADSTFFLTKMNWLVVLVYLPLWKMTESLGMMIMMKFPNIPNCFWKVIIHSCSSHHQVFFTLKTHTTGVISAVEKPVAPTFARHLGPTLCENSGPLSEAFLSIEPLSTTWRFWTKAGGLREKREKPHKWRAKHQKNWSWPYDGPFLMRKKWYHLVI